MKPLVFLAFAISAVYPFIVYWGLQNVDARMLLPLVAVVLGTRWLIKDDSAERGVVLATVIGVVITILVGGYQLGLKSYPVLMSLGFLFVFACSLFSEMTIVERIARMQEPDLPVEAIDYTRKVTWVWSVFFLLNALVSAGTALWANDELWMLYNGFIAYLLIGGLAGGEWLVRRRVRRG